MPCLQHAPQLSKCSDTVRIQEKKASTATGNIKLCGSDLPPHKKYVVSSTDASYAYPATLALVSDNSSADSALLCSRAAEVNVTDSIDQSGASMSVRSKPQMSLLSTACTPIAIELSLTMIKDRNHT
jgi:hypothetical protein